MRNSLKISNGVKKPRGASSLKQILPKIFEDLEKRTLSEDIKKIWEKIIGTSAAVHTKIASFKKDVLTVDVDSSMWIYELTLKKSQILETLKKEQFFRNLKDIRFRIGEIGSHEQGSTCIGG